MSIKALDSHTVRSLNSGQGITSLESIVKELLENSIDANATSIELLFIENGLESIQLKDNGVGINESDRSFAAKRYYTSKLNEFKDLENVITFGFRGEAMNSICTISSKVILTTKTRNDPIGMQYDMDQEGNLLNPRPSNMIPVSGTMVQLFRPFHNLPVRRQLAYKNASQNMKKMHDLVVKYALSYPKIRFSYQIKTLQNQQQSSWIKPVTKSIENSISIIYSAQLSANLETCIESEDALTIELILPKPNSDPTIIYKEDRLFVYVNQRPIQYIQSELKDVISLIKDRYRETIGLSINNKKAPFIYLDIQLPPHEYDVNVEPSKSTILFHNKQLIYNLVEKIVDQVYPTKIHKFFNGPQYNSRQIKTMEPEDDDDEPLFITSDKQSHVSEPNHRIIENPVVHIVSNQIETLDKDNEGFVDKLEREERIDGIDKLAEKEPIDNVDQLAEKEPIDNVDQLAEKELVDNVDELAEEEYLIRSISPSSINPTSDSAEKSPLPIEPMGPMERSFTFSMISDDEDGGDSFRETLHNNVLSDFQPEPTDTCAKRTLLDHWQIDNNDDTQPLTTQVLPDTLPQPTSPALSEASDNTVPLATVQKKRPLETSAREQPTIKKPKSATLAFRNFQDVHPKELCRTLNQTQTVSCSLDTLRANYGKRSKDERVRTTDCLFRSEGGVITNLMRVPKLNKYGVTLYTRGLKPAQVNEIGAVDLKKLHVNKIFKELLKDQQLICKSLLERPVQIQFNGEDELCPILLSLESKEVYIKDDFHGNKNMTFSEVTDERVMMNGFRVRWRKEPYASHIIVQLTGIYSLGSGYGPSDFRELLYLLKEGTKRPKKVEKYLWTLAYEMCKSRPEEDKQQILDELNELRWDKEKDTQWEIGYSALNHTIGCKLRK